MSVGRRQSLEKESHSSNPAQIRAMFNAVLDQDSDAAIPTIRRWLRDYFYRSIYVGTPADIQRYKAAFPEAHVEIMTRPPAPTMPVPW